MRNIRILMPAQNEMSNAFVASSRRGEFENLVRSILQDIADAVLIPAVDRKTGCAEIPLRHRFPYVLIVFIDMQEVVLVAFAHGRQKRGYWKRRLKLI